jgi:hypothetical protein|tara:strand:+ start:4956 stop:5084 length:129 start_codon:yes stop_codon:yes gene_type:complete
MPRGKYESGTKVNFNDITEFEGAYDNSEDKQNRERDNQQGIK